MISTYRNRPIILTEPVQVYRNLNRKDVMWSLRQNGLVIGHAMSLCLRDAKMIVRKGGQARVRIEKQKNVHAFISGRLTSFPYDFCSRPLSYNPYTDDGFIENGQVMTHAKFVYLSDNGTALCRLVNDL